MATKKSAVPVEVKAELSDEDRLYAQYRGELKHLPPGELAVERERLQQTIRTRVGNATMKVTIRYKVVCELLKGMGL